MLDSPFPVPSRCKLNHISVCFIQIRTKITYKQLISFRESDVFFKVIPGVLGCSVNLNIIQRFLLRRAVFPDYLSVSCDYGEIEFCTIQFLQFSLYLNEGIVNLNNISLIKSYILNENSIKVSQIILLDKFSHKGKLNTYPLNSTTEYIIPTLRFEDNYFEEIDTRLK